MAGRSRRGFAGSPDVMEAPRISFKREMSARVAGNGRSIVVGVWNLKVPSSPEFPPARFMSRLRSRVAKAMRLISVQRVSPRSYPAAGSRQFPASRVEDMHRTEAVEDCIEFFNACGSLQRSNSVS